MNHNGIYRLIAFLIRHLVASIVSIVAAVLVVVVAYFMLLIIAIWGNFGLGGPFALPFGVTAAWILSLLYTACLLFPAVLFAEVVSKKLQSQRFISQVLISTAALASLVFLFALGVRQLIHDDSSPVFNLAGHPLPIFLALCIPLGLYWWVTKIVQTATTGIIGLCKKASRKEKVNSPSSTGHLI